MKTIKEIKEKIKSVEAKLSELGFSQEANKFQKLHLKLIDSLNFNVEFSEEEMKLINSL